MLHRSLKIVAHTTKKQTQKTSNIIEGTHVSRRPCCSRNSWNTFWTIVVVHSLAWTWLCSCCCRHCCCFRCWCWRCYCCCCYCYCCCCCYLSWCCWPHWPPKRWSPWQSSWRWVRWNHDNKLSIFNWIELISIYRLSWKNASENSSTLSHFCFDILISSSSFSSLAVCRKWCTCR